MNEIVPHPKLGRIGIVASGCGLRSCLHLGYLRSLLRHGLGPHISYMFGVSGSALTLASIAQADDLSNPTRALSYPEKKWRFIDRTGPKSIFDFPDVMTDGKFSYKKGLLSLVRGKIHLLNRTGLLSPEPLRNLLDEFNPVRVIASPIRFDFRVFNHERGDYEIISNHDAERFDPAHGGNPSHLGDFLVASAALDAIFEQVVVNGVPYSDGDAFEVLPAFEHGCDTVFVWFCYPPKVDESRGSAYETIKKHVPMALQGIVNKYNSLRHRDRKKLDYALRELYLMGLEANAQREARSLGAKLRSTVERFREKLLDEMQHIFDEQNDSPESPPTPILMPVFTDETFPDTLTALDFAPGDVTKGINAAEAKMDRVLSRLSL